METVAQDGLRVKAIVQVNETAVRGELKEMVRQRKVLSESRVAEYKDNN